MYRHHIIRDLVWAIASPPVLLPEKQACEWYNDDWFHALYASSWHLLQQLDRAPEKLQQALDEQKDRRLGRYFETLWAFWLEQHPRFEIIEHGLALRDDTKTLGEIDFLVFDRDSGKCLHWEMAVKFYLGVDDTNMQRNWHGPGKKDRLDLKVQHLCEKQSVISQRPAVKKILHGLGYQVDSCGVILKGRLYYPQQVSTRGPADANPNHLRGYWITLRDWLQKEAYTGMDEPRYYPLVGFGWMAEVDIEAGNGSLGRDELVAAIQSGKFHLPLHVAFMQDNGKSVRIFIVPDDWEDELL